MTDSGIGIGVPLRGRGGSVSAPYTYNAVNFDGASYLEYTYATSTVADATSATVSGWLRPDASQTDALGYIAQVYPSSGASSLSIFWNKANTRLHCVFTDADVPGNLNTTVFTPSTSVPAGSWTHFFGGIISTGGFTLVLNGNTGSPAITEALTNGRTMRLSNTVGARIGTNIAGTGTFKGDLADLFVHFGTLPADTDAAAVAAYGSGNGADFGATGSSGPTAAQPHVFFGQDSSASLPVGQSWNDGYNRGSLGNGAVWTMI